MLNDWNTMENANLLERKLLKRVDELPIGTVIYGLNHNNEVGFWVINKKSGDSIYLYEPQAYYEQTFIVKTDDNKELRFKDTELQKARVYFKDKTYKQVEIFNMGRTENSIDFSKIEPNTSRFNFVTYPISKKEKEKEVKLELANTRHWVDRIYYGDYVLPAFNSDGSKFYPNIKNTDLQRIAKNIHSQLKYRFKNPNEYVICNYLIKSKDSNKDKLKMLEKLQTLPIYNYNVTDIRYSVLNNEFTVRIDDVKIDLNSDIDISNETVRLLDLQECRHCKCSGCKYNNEETCLKNVQIFRDGTPCRLYSPNRLYKAFNTEWDKTTTEAKQSYLDFVKKYSDNNKKTIISKDDKNNVIYFTDDTVFDRKPNEIIKAKYKETYYLRRTKNRFVIEEL